MAKFAVITGASSGIGLELAKLAAADGYALLLVADTPFVDVEPALPSGTEVETVEIDLATIDGVDRLLAAVGSRQIDLLCANAGHGLGGAFIDHAVADWRHVIDTNITGTIYLLQKILGPMLARDDGKILVTGSIAGYIPGSYSAVYNGSKAFVDNFTAAVRDEIKDKKGVTLTTLMPGPVETNFFHRAGMDDTKVGQSEKYTAEKTAKDGWDALMDGKDTIISGIQSKLQVASAGVMPSSIPAAQHGAQAKPGSGSNA